MADNFRFDEKEHIYYSGERIIPGVTDIVGEVYGSPHFATDWHLNRGSQIHKAISLYLQETLDEKSVDERIRGRLEAAKRAIKELDLSDYKLIEMPMSHSLYQFAGTPDLIVRDMLIDWKSSSMPETEPQMGGYVLLAETRNLKVKTCLEVVLDDDGKYKRTDFKAARCKGLFLAGLTVFNWRKNGGK